MIGLLFIGVYFAFLLFAMLFPILVFRKKTNAHIKKRVILSSVILSIPFIVYAIERSLFELECDKNILIYPDAKLERPLSIVYSGNVSKGDGSYKEIDGEHRLNLFSDFPVEYIVSIDSVNNIKTLNKKSIGEILRKGTVFPDKLKEVTAQEKDGALSAARYIIYGDREVKYNMILIKKYIFDFEANRIVSEVSGVSHSKGQDLINILYPYEFGWCSKIESRYGITEDLLKKTFK